MTWLGTRVVRAPWDWDDLAPGEESGIEQVPFCPSWRIRRAPLPVAMVVRR
jgi:hypothetical protein